MSYTRIRVYLFTKTYAYTVFQKYIHKAGRREKQKLKRRIAKMLLLKPNAAMSITDINSILHHDGKLSVYVRIEHEHALLDPAIERVVGAVTRSRSMRTASAVVPI